MVVIDETVPLCEPKSDEDWSKLHPSARMFLQDLHLPQVHPHCTDDSKFKAHQKGQPLPLEKENLPNNFYYETSSIGGLIGSIITVWCQVSSLLLAVVEFLLRLFAFIIGPSVVCFLIIKAFELSGNDAVKSLPHDATEGDIANVKKLEMRLSFVLILGMVASTILVTDTMYVHTLGRSCGAIHSILILVLSFRIIESFQFHHLFLAIALSVIMLLSAYLILGSNRHGDDYYSHPGIDLPTTKPGFYYSKSNSFMHRVAQLWPEETRTYDMKHGATPYLLTGDSLTFIPYLVNTTPTPTYHRLWVENPNDYEAVALDVAFPSSENGGHDTTKPVYLILHGTNEGDLEGYVHEFVMQRTKEGNTCIVMIARGMMDTPIRGWNVFHGARVTDVEAASKAIRKAMNNKEQLLAGVGFSMGAIILSNYVARSGEDCHLNVAISASGGLDSREDINYQRTERVWQPMVTPSWRTEYITKQFDIPFRQRLTKEEHLSLMRAFATTQLDEAVAKYYKFNNLLDYYSEMSAMGDSTKFQRKKASTTDDNNKVGRIANVAIPLCLIHALDDPLVTWRSMGHDIESLVKTGEGNLMILLTKSGGHVSWPLGLNPKVEGWKWMNTAIRDFVNSVESVKKDDNSEEENEEEVTIEIS